MSNPAPRPLHRFGDFVLDEGEKQLRHAGAPIAVNPRYFDALLLLVRNPGALITKDRFFDDVWSGVTVGDEALTQCIKSLRKSLGDLHRDPQFIATVPKHGYRFIAPVETVTQAGNDAPAAVDKGVATPLQLALAGTLGGGMAGIIGGVIYGFAAVGSGGGAMSVLTVLVTLTLAVGLLGAFGVCFGMAAASILLKRDWTFSVIGAAAGGLLVGAAFNILGTDSLHLLFGRAPSGFTGGFEGAVLGAGIAAGARLGGGLAAPGWRTPLTAGIGAALAGALISLCGGKLMGGSLGALASAFEQSELEFGAIGRLSADPAFGPVAQALAAGVEGFLFAIGMVGAMVVLHRRRG